MPTSLTHIRLGAVALAIAGVLFVLYPATRPWHDESTLDGAEQAMSSGWWVASHLFAMIGFILVPLGLLALHSAVSRTPAASLALAAAVTGWIGAGLTLPYYGAEDFALHAIATKSTEGQPLDLLDLADAIRFDPVAATTFLAGLLLLGVAAVLAAIAIWRSAVLPRYSGLPLALGFALFFAQFFTPPAARIGHGLLVGIGSAWVALTLWNAARNAPPVSTTRQANDQYRRPPGRQVLPDQVLPGNRRTTTTTLGRSPQPRAHAPRIGCSIPPMSRHSLVELVHLFDHPQVRIRSQACKRFLDLRVCTAITSQRGQKVEATGLAESTHQERVRT